MKLLPDVSESISAALDYLETRTECDHFFYLLPIFFLWAE